MTTQSTILPKSLHLAPRSQATQRIWNVGDSPSEAATQNLSVFWLAVLVDDHETFASLSSILTQLRPFAFPKQLAELDNVQSLLSNVNNQYSEIFDGAEEQAFAESVAFALMRRISRESIYTAPIIDQGARVINSILARRPDGLRVHVDSIDRLDRPTIKVLARAMLLLEPEHGFSWVWHSRSDPTDPSTADSNDLFTVSRGQLLRQLVGLLKPGGQENGRYGLVVKQQFRLGKAVLRIHNLRQMGES